jgi:hypothetical protein
LSDVVDQHKTLHRSLAHDLALALKLCQERRNHRLEVDRAWRTPVSGEERYGMTECSMCNALAFASGGDTCVLRRPYARKEEECVGAKTDEDRPQQIGRQEWQHGGRVRKRVELAEKPDVRSTCSTLSETVYQQNKERLEAMLLPHSNFQPSNQAERQSG